MRHHARSLACVLVLLFVSVHVTTAQPSRQQADPSPDSAAPSAGQHTVHVPLLMAPPKQPAQPTPTTVPSTSPTSPAQPSPTPRPTVSPDKTYSGDATYYGATGAGNCGFDPSPNDLMVGAMNQTDYANAALCGAYVQITGPKAVIVVRIVDRCPECKPGDIDLSQEAFARIAEPIQGRVRITWRIISGNVSGPIAYRFKEGSSRWWTAVQIRNHRNPIAKLEYLDSGGQYKAIPRQEYNYFVQESGLGPGPYTFRVTDIYGNTLIDRNIPLSVGSVVNGSGQFPPKP